MGEWSSEYFVLGAVDFVAVVAGQRGTLAAGSGRTGLGAGSPSMHSAAGADGIPPFDYRGNFVESGWMKEAGAPAGPVVASAAGIGIESWNLTGSTLACALTGHTAETPCEETRTGMTLMKCFADGQIKGIPSFGLIRAVARIEGGVPWVTDLGIGHRILSAV